MRNVAILSAALSSVPPPPACRSARVVVVLRFRTCGRRHPSQNSKQNKERQGGQRTMASFTRHTSHSHRQLAVGKCASKECAPYVTWTCRIKVTRRNATPQLVDPNIHFLSGIQYVTTPAKIYILLRLSAAYRAY